jgi:FtsH-binding integral membrane protein
VSDLQRELDPQTDVAALEVESELRRHLVRVYALMGIGLMISAAIAFWLSRTVSVTEYVPQNPLSFQILFIFEMVVVAFVSKAVDKLSLAATATLFFGYAVLNGFSFAVFFAWIPPASIASGFVMTAVTFGAMALFGHQTGRDLGGLSSFFIMVGIGVALLVTVNLVLRSSVAYWATAYMGVMVFSSLSFYHSQSLRDLEWEFEDDDADRCKAMYASALTLYLDFVNLYALIMRLGDPESANRRR